MVCQLNYLKVFGNNPFFVCSRIPGIINLLSLHLLLLLLLFTLQIFIHILALSPDGSAMGTVHTTLPEEDVGGSTTLKFWSCVSNAKKGYNLSTVIHEPHR